MGEPFLCLWKDCEQGGRGQGAEFSAAGQYYKHVASHAEEYRGDKLPKLACLWKSGGGDGDAHCTFKASTVSKLKEHLKSHSQEKSVACPTCGGLFSNRSKLFDHCLRQVREAEFKSP